MQATPKRQFFPVRVPSVPTGLPLCYDTYLRLNSDYVLFRKIGDTISSERMRSLLKHNLKQFYIPMEQKDSYRNSLKQYMQREDLSAEMRGKFIKETAFNHIEELFSQTTVADLIKDSASLVEEMVNFITDDLEGAANLMKLSSHDYYTYNHSVNVAVYTVAICKRVLNPSREELINAGLGGLLHDLGKRAIDRQIINKPGKLSPEEWKEIKKHPTYGFKLLEKATSVSEETKRIVHEHHENIDGTGYPQCLSDQQISPLSKIACIADVFDALTTNRSYKEATSPKVALEIMASMAPGKFDRSLFTYFGHNMDSKHPVTLDKDCEPCLEGIEIKKAG